MSKIVLILARNFKKETKKFIMKNLKINSLRSIFVLVAIVAFNSCSVIEDLEYVVVENPLQMHGGEVTLKINGKFIEKGLNSKAVAEVTPIYFCKDGNEIPFQTEIFQGAKAAGNGKVVPKEGMSFSYSSTIPFQKCMSQGEVKVRVVVKKGTEVAAEILTEKIADGTIDTPLLLDLDDHVILANDEFVRVNTFTKSATLNFSKGKKNITNKEIRDEDVTELLAFVKSSLEEGSRIEVKSVGIESYASPEGEVDLNTDLAEDRAKSAQSFFKGKAKRMKIDAAKEDGFYTLSPKGEDWAGFKTEVNKTTHEDKELILRVLEMTADLTKREQEIRNMAKTYKFLEKEVLPQLRRAQIIVNYDQVGYSDDELKALAMSNPDTLNVEEILKAATLEENINDKLRVYKEAQRIFTNDWRTSNNVGYTLYMMGDVAGATEAFDKAASIGDNELVSNNVGAVTHRNEGKSTDRINELLSASNTTESKYNMGLIQIEEGKYEEAITSMGETKSFNVALAQLLAGHNDDASQTLDANQDNPALNYYLKAIIGARTNNSEMVMDNLKSAFEKDASLKNKAKSDREFIKFLENADFLAIF
jgi:tetratricopeptide (TPR) repeat protein